MLQCVAVCCSVLQCVAVTHSSGRRGGALLGRARALLRSKNPDDTPVHACVCVCVCMCERERERQRQRQRVCVRVCVHVCVRVGV